VHERGVTDASGLYFLGLLFQHSLASSMINGVGADAAVVARHIAERSAGREPVAAPTSGPASI
jgi:putative flavoprotein involved in K+ transport